MRYLLLLTFSLFSFSTIASPFPDEPYISVTGSASLAIKADQVIIGFQPSVLNSSGEVAKKALDAKVTTLLSHLKQAGFSADSVESISQSTRPEYEYNKNKRSLVGVRVTHELSYRLTDISKVNSFIDALLKAKVESISALQYGLQTPDKWQSQVRQLAVLDSQQKALALAKLYDAKLGKVYSINYQYSNVQPVLMRAMAMESDALNIKPKNIMLTDHVETLFILKP
ncbi:SIMPL domain-containing protein [Psychromonas hadalis]|uniref:SIMPL domain-containing protein n=1 Tax=Psychromonas hadalis TaxID=211669 RepID=UPI0003B59AE3|nr:SIMPL domain-containing protein [Psychromonas hadalis]